MYLEIEPGFDRIVNIKVEGSPYNDNWPMVCPYCKAGVIATTGTTLPTLEVIFRCGSKYWLRDKQLMTVHAGAPCSGCDNYVGLGEWHRCAGVEE